jgi:Uma2 family endonuclease
MSAMPKPRKLTVEEYFAIELKAERKSEFFDGEMFLMAGASREHNFIVSNLIDRLPEQLRGSCRVFVSDMRLKVSRTGLYTYPDLLIVCDPPEYAPENRDTLTNPQVVIEVLSNSTERYDRTTKFRHYKQLPSVMEYVLVSQTEALIERYTRQANETWAQADFVGLDTTFTLATVKVSVPMADIFRGVEFQPLPDRA